MKRNKCLIFNILFVLFISILIPSCVNAASINVSKGGWIKFSTYGINTGTGNYRTSYKTASDGTVVYCVRFEKEFTAGSYTSCSVVSDEKLIIAGQIVDLINAKDWSDEKKYAYKVAALNKALNLSGSGNFSGGSDLTINSIITDAQNSAKSYTSLSNSTLGTISHNLSSATMSKLGNDTTFISKKLTFNGLKSSVLGATPTYKFTVSGLESGQSAYLCTKANGTSCTEVSAVTLSGVESKAYYVKVTGVDSTNAGLNFSIKITGSVKVSYSKGETYCKSGLQEVLLTKKYSKSISNKDTVNFKVNKVVNNTHQIEILKVDESGEAVPGARFQYDGPLTFNESVSSDGTRFTYTYGPVDSTEDQFFGKEYCFTEIAAPDGFVLKSNNRLCYTVNRNENSSTCYYNGDDSDGTEVEDDYCNTNIINICKKTTTSYREESVTPPVSGDNNDNGTGDNTTPTYVLDESTATITYSAFDDSCVASDDQTTSKVEVEKVCGILGNGNTYTAKDAKYCANPGNYEKVVVDDGNLFVTRVNEKNTLKISKKTATGSDEVPGAKLKICTEAEYTTARVKTECTAAKTVNDVEMSWVSGNTVKEFGGIKAGNYYIIETLPPSGYKLVSTATKFTVDESGNVKTGDTTVTDNTLVINNELTKIVISKDDIATSKEVPGAKLSICEIVKIREETEVDATAEQSNDVYNGSIGSNDEDGENETTVIDVDNNKYQMDLDINGDCIPARLADGTEATWTSGTTPKTIEGLPAGTYYLVEKLAPKGYDTAEAIIFKLNADGTLTDKDGKSLADNKLVMHDKSVTEVKTGMLPIILAACFAFVSLGALWYVNVYSKRKASSNNN